eukprot:TRINITY_DN1557_c0_g1_i2.p1 TRINITY_DN1557_c0_g1~~TRINITY_DN1557_c0_g1_i2.p1  ORF type:complete len:163 (+),score=97.14 TRINITY_DN1557_c0_g1_i2:246-734(+)
MQENDLTSFKESIKKWIERFSAEKEEEKNSKLKKKMEEDEMRLKKSKEESEKHQEELKDVQLSKEERKKRNELLARYAYEENLDENGDLVFGDDKETQKDPATGIEMNTNALRVKMKEQADREKSKVAHEKKVAKDKEQRAKELEKKEKEKKRTQKKEKQRL